MDLLVLIFLVYYIGKMARAKGLPVLRWRLRLFWAFFCAEVAIGLGSHFIMHKSLIVASVSGLLAAILATILIFQWFKKEAEQQDLRENQES